MNTILNNVEDSMPISPEVAVQDRENDVNRAEVEGVSRPQRHVGLRAFVETLGAGFFIKVCGLILGVVLARLLGPTGRGSLETVIFWPSLFAVSGLLGVDMAIKRRAATEHDIGPLTRTAFPLSLVLSAITIIICYFSLPYLFPHKQHQLLPLAILFLAFIPANHFALNLQAVDEGTGHFRRYNLIRSILNPVWLLAILVIWLVGLCSVAWFVIALLLAMYVVAATRVVVALRSFPITGPICPPLQILREGSPFALSRILELLYAKADKILIIWLLGPRAMGLYVVALAGGLLLSSTFGVSASAVVFAIAAQSLGRGGFERSAKVFRGTTLMLLFAGGCLMLLIPLLLPIIYGSRFADAVLPGILLIIGSVLEMQARLLDSCFRGHGRVFPGIAARLAAMITLVVLGFITYAQWNILGVTCAFVVAQAVYLCLLIVNVTKHYGKVASLQLIPTSRDGREVLARIRHYFSSR